MIYSFGLEKIGNIGVTSFLEQVMCEVHLGIVVLDHLRKIRGISRMACEWLGVKKEEVLDLTLEDAFPNIGEGHFLASSILDGTTMQDQVFSWSIGKRQYEFIVDSFVIRDHNGAIQFGCYTFKNAKNKRVMEQKIERSDRLAMIGQIAAGTAHEIRNPLTSIRGFLQIMGRTMEMAGMIKEKEYTEIMLHEIKRINDLVGEFLLLSRPKEVQYRLVDIDEVFSGILPIVESEALLHGIEVIINKGLDPYLIVGDSELLKQVLLNLSKNAIEAMGNEGTLTIDLLHTHKGIEIRLTDTGPGIPPYLLDKIFDPFFTTKEEGTGLGLSVCQKIINDMGGHIQVASTGHGATFSLSFALKG